MQCTRCQVTFTKNNGRVFSLDSYIGDAGENHSALVRHECPDCRQMILVLQLSEPMSSGLVMRKVQLFPQTSGRKLSPSCVPNHIAADYNEACAVLCISPKSAAALARRALQGLLLERKYSTKSKLADAIQDFLSATPPPPADLLSIVDTVRQVGNFAAHPQKGEVANGICAVEEDEASWTLDVLEKLFDYCYETPIRNAAMLERFDARAKSIKSSEPLASESLAQQI
jgi:Domain of unknown function (DUF4145)